MFVSASSQRRGRPPLCRPRCITRPTQRVAAEARRLGIGQLVYIPGSVPMLNRERRIRSHGQGGRAVIPPVPSWSGLRLCLGLVYIGRACSRIREGIWCCCGANQ